MADIFTLKPRLVQACSDMAQQNLCMGFFMLLYLFILKEDEFSDYAICASPLFCAVATHLFT